MAPPQTPKSDIKTVGNGHLRANYGPAVPEVLKTELGQPDDDDYSVPNYNNHTTFEETETAASPTFPYNSNS